MKDKNRNLFLLDNLFLFVMMLCAMKQMLLSLKGLRHGIYLPLNYSSIFFPSGSREVREPAVPLLVRAGPAAGPGPAQPLPGLRPQRLVSTQAGHTGGQDSAGEDSGWVFRIFIPDTKIISKSINR